MTTLFYRSAAFALKIKNGSQEDAAIAGGPRSEEATRERLRFVEERGNQGAVGRGEILPIEDVGTEGPQRQAVFAGDGDIQPTGATLIAAKAAAAETAAVAMETRAAIFIIQFWAEANHLGYPQIQAVI